MYKYDPRYDRSPKLKPESGQKAVDFPVEDFSQSKDFFPSKSIETNQLSGVQELDESGSDFIAEVDADTDYPSLNDLFKPFDLDVPYPSPADEPYEDLFSASVEDFNYEDLDTRDPEVIQTLGTAKKEAAQIIKDAEAKAEELMKKAKNEAAALVADLKRREEHRQEGVRNEIEELKNGLQKKRQDLDEALASAAQKIQETEEEKKEAETRKAEADNCLSDLEEKKAALQQEHDERLKIMEESKASLMAEARVAGHEEGRQAGFLEGEKNGRQEALEKFQDQVEDFLSAAEKLENIYDELWRANSPLMIKLAIEAAERIVNKELSHAEDLAAYAFKACIDYLARAHRVTVLVRPQDIEKLEMAKAEQRQRLGALVKVDFKAEPTLGPGDLIIESDIGRLDGTIKYRTAQVMEVLRKAFDERYGHQEAEIKSESQPEPPAFLEPGFEAQASTDDSVRTDIANGADIAVESGQEHE